MDLLVFDKADSIDYVIANSNKHRFNDRLRVKSYESKNV